MLAPNEKSIKILKLNLYGSSDKEVYIPYNPASLIQS